jgi:hypothetical protein
MQGSKIPLALALAVLALAAAPRTASAAVLDVPCDPLALQDAVTAAGSNGEEDVLWLYAPCTYLLPSTLLGQADAGYPLTIHGRGAKLSGLDEHRVLYVNTGAVVFLNDVTVTDGASPGDGGGLYNAGTLTLTRTTVSSSQSATGAGIYNADGARLTVLRSTIIGNAASNYGGGIRNRKGRLTVIDSAVVGNQGNPMGSTAGGGGILNDGQGARATLTNTTISGNTARFGAGVFNDEGVMAISHCTLAANVTTDGGNGGSLYYRNYLGAGKMKVGHSILADTVFELPGYECVRDPFLPTKLIAASGPSLVEDGSCEIVGALADDPALGAQAGSPAYRPLLPGSPAIDAGIGARCAGVDQRGVSRPQDGDGDGTNACDLGSYEAE